MQSTAEGSYDESEADLIAAIGRYLAVAVENQRMVTRYNGLQITICSPIWPTIQSCFERSTAKSARELEPSRLGNFTQHHQLRYRVLRSVANSLRDLLKADEEIRVGRYGGDVFLFILPPRPKDTCLEFVDRLWQRCLALQYRVGDQHIPISIACGYAMAPLDAATRAEMSRLSRIAAVLVANKAAAPSAKMTSTPTIARFVRRH